MPILARTPPVSSGSSQRAPRKSSSFLSLRREKDKSPTPTDAYGPYPPSIPRLTYFDAYPSSTSSLHSRTSKSKGRKPSPARTDPSCHDSFSSTKRRKDKDNSTTPFPVFDSAHDSASSTGHSTPKPYTRTRSRTGPSKRSNWTDSPPIPQLRFSGSSTRTHCDTPPHTPIDNSSLRGYQVVVAAPVSGVETMDALVDGMNGGDDIFSGGMRDRARFGIPGHHPLYQPPLPTPPPGVMLGGVKPRKSSRIRTPSNSGDEDDDPPKSAPPMRSRRHRTQRPPPTRTPSNSTITPPTPRTPTRLENEVPLSSSHTAVRSSFASSIDEKPKIVAPSISEIIRNHAPPSAQIRSRPFAPSVGTHSTGHSTVFEEPESEPEPLTAEEEAEFMSRSSIDSIADEVRRTIRNQNPLKVTTPPVCMPPQVYNFSNRYSVVSDTTSHQSPDPGVEKASLYSSSISHYQPPSPLDSPSFLTLARTTPSQAVAQYLRSTRLTTLLKLTRTPHASQDNPLVVSLSDLGNPTGFPLVVFLGLGCVRHIMGLYDEMAECLGLRLITIDRWGLGRTEPRAKSAKGIMQWAAVVEEVLDLLHIDQCSVMAHSAGAPYALSFANKLPKRIRGDVCLLAPWVGGGDGGGYKWLKYVPNGILKTAQAAEWKLQAWMIGKPPTIAFEGIGYNAQTSSSHTKLILSRKPSPPRSNGNLTVVYPSSENGSRPSMGSLNISEYDDLRDFDGRFESRSTLGGIEVSHKRVASDNKSTITKRQLSRGFLERLKGSKSQPQSPTEDRPTTTAGKRLKALRSMSSLKGKSASQAHNARKSDASSPMLPLPQPLAIELGLGFDKLNWPKIDQDDMAVAREKFDANRSKSPTRMGGHRSISITTPPTPLPVPGSPGQSSFNSSFVGNISGTYQAALGNALIAASHAESANGTHNDLLQILNHDNHPLGFSYTAYPHKVQVWYGDKDEKIAENAVRWMERNMGEGRCYVNVVKGADHGLMYKSSVVVEVLEHVSRYWQNDI